MAFCLKTDRKWNEFFPHRDTSFSSPGDFRIPVLKTIILPYEIPKKTCGNLSCLVHWPSLLSKNANELDFICSHPINDKGTLKSIRFSKGEIFLDTNSLLFTGCSGNHKLCVLNALCSPQKMHKHCFQLIQEKFETMGGGGGGGGDK